MKYIKRALCINICLYLSTLTSTSTNEHRKLIIINDILNEDFDEDFIICNEKAMIPGPISLTLRNGIDAACAPIIASESLVYYLYNFMNVAHDFFEKSPQELEKKYGNQVTDHPQDTTQNVQKIAIFFMEQFQLMQHTAYEFYKKHNVFNAQQQDALAINLINEILKTLYESHHSIEEGNQLIQQLHISDTALDMAQLMVTFYRCFDAKNWHVFKTKHNNVVLVPISYPQHDFNYKNLAKISIEQIQKPSQLNNDTPNIIQKNIDFITDIESFINDANVSYEEKKLLDICMIGHGVMKAENGRIAGFLLSQFDNLISVFSKNKVFSLFYLTCHGGGMNAKKIWFNTLSKNQIPFLIIISPMTEQPFSINSPYWTEALYNAAKNQTFLLPYFLKKATLSYIPLPDFQEYFNNCEDKLPFAIDNGLYKPIELSYSDNTTLASQIALIKFPGVEWFSPYFLHQKVLEITKTRAARASAERKKIVQTPNIDIIAFSTPVMYAPLEINQTKKLRFVSLIPYDFSYQSSPDKISVFIKMIIIHSSIYENPKDILINLARENIAPCSVISLKSNSAKTSTLRKNFIIKKIEDVHGNLLATDFVVSGDGAFYRDGTTKKLHYFNLESGRPTTSLTSTQKASFDEAFKHLQDSFRKDQDLVTSQGVQQKINVMKKLIDINTEKAVLARSVSSEEELQEKIQALIKEKIRKNKERELQNEA